MQPRVWKSGWKAKDEGGEEERKIHLPALIVYLGNSVYGQMEFMIGAVGHILIDTCQSLECFSSMQIQGKCFLVSLLWSKFGDTRTNLSTQIGF